MIVERVRVGDVLRLERRPVDPDPTKEYVSIGVRSFGKGIFHYDPTLGNQLGKLRFFEVVPARLVVSNIKGWEGAVAVSTDEDAGCVASNRFLTYVPCDDRIDVRWARWYFLSDSGLQLIQQSSPGSADRNRTLAISRFEALEIPLPSIDEQQRVANRLQALEASASKLRRRVEHASLLSTALAVSAVTQPDIAESAKASAGWRRLRLAEVLTNRNEEVPVQDSASYDIAGVYSFGRGIFRRGPLAGSGTSYRALHRLRKGQVVMSRLKAWEGAIAVVPADLDGWYLSPEFPTFDIDMAQVDVDYFGSLITSEPFWRSLRGESRGIGARRERVHASRLLEQVVDLPPISIQRSIARTLRFLHGAESLRSGAPGRIDALVPAAINEEFAGLS